MSDTKEIETRLARMVEAVEKDEARIGVYSTGERIAIALILDRHDLLKEFWGSILESVERLGPEWTKAALNVQRNR